MKKYVRDLKFRQFERLRPSASKTKSSKTKVYVLSDMLLLTKSGMSKKVYYFPFISSVIRKQALDKDEKQMKVVIHDKSQTSTPESLQTPDNPILFEITCLSKEERDVFYNEINTLIMEVKGKEEK
jgi:hypothetical protein